MLGLGKGGCKVDGEDEGEGLRSGVRVRVRVTENSSVEGQT